jgi:hypothetical protein
MVEGNGDSPSPELKYSDVRGNLKFTGEGSWFIDNNQRTVKLTGVGIRNDAYVASGEFVVMFTAHRQDGSGAYLIGIFANPTPLPARSRDVYSGAAPLQPVPDGVYEMYVSLFENENRLSDTNCVEGFCLDDLLKNPKLIRISGGNYSYVDDTTSSNKAIEYYHAAFDHYFITANANEISLLDGGAFQGWARTGNSFSVYPLGQQSPVCRFFSTSFAPKSSHFYTGIASECAAVKKNPNWQFEAEVFGMAQPSATGACATGQQSLYRLYNNGMSGAPNHRYTTSSSVRSTMIGRGWIPEGYGAQGVIGCVPQ